MAGFDPSVAKEGDPDSIAASSLEEAEAEPSEQTRLLTRALDAIPGAWEQAELGRAQGAAGETTPLDRL